MAAASTTATAEINDRTVGVDQGAEEEEEEEEEDVCGVGRGQRHHRRPLWYLLLQRCWRRRRRQQVPREQKPQLLQSVGWEMMIGWMEDGGE
jgi:hypothetical protein